MPGPGGDAVTRYAAMPATAWDAHGEWFRMGSRPTETVYEADRTPRPTGLVDQHGTPIYRLRETVPMGFAVAPRKGGGDA